MPFPPAGPHHRSILPPSPPPPPRSPTLRSILAVVAGFLSIGVLSVGADLLLWRMMPGAFDPNGRVESTGVLLGMQLYVAVFAITGCYLAARLAGRSPMRHAMILGALGLAFNVAGTVARWDHAPAWAHVLALALVLPYAWVGGCGCARSRASRSR